MIPRSKMMIPRHRRLALIIAALVMLFAAAGLILFAMRDTIVFFYTPSEALEKARPGQRLRIGGLVDKGSLQRGQGRQVQFRVSDSLKTLTITYEGILPDLFREGQGVVVEGALETGGLATGGVERGGLFRADNVLARHDERYMPRELVEALKKEGRWQENGSMPGTAMPGTANPSTAKQLLPATTPPATMPPPPARGSSTP